MSVTNGNDQLGRLLDAVATSAGGAARAPEPARSWRAGRRRRTARVTAQATGALALAAALVAVPALVERLSEGSHGIKGGVASPSPLPPSPPPGELRWPKGPPAATVELDGTDHALYTTTFQGRLCVAASVLPVEFMRQHERNGSWPVWTCADDEPETRVGNGSWTPPAFGTRPAAQLLDTDCGLAAEDAAGDQGGGGDRSPVSRCVLIGLAKRSVAQVRLALLDGRTIEVPASQVRDVRDTDYRFFAVAVPEWVTVDAVEAYDTIGTILSRQPFDANGDEPDMPLPGPIPEGGLAAFLTFTPSLPPEDRTRILVAVERWGGELRSNADDQAIVAVWGYWDQIKAILDTEHAAGRLRYETPHLLPEVATPSPGVPTPGP